MQREVKFGEWMEAGFKVYKENLAILIPAMLVAVLLSLVTGGILAGPMMAGMVIIVLRLLDGKESKPTIGTVFEGFNYFLQSFLFFLVWGIMTMVGFVILMLIPCVGGPIAYAGMLVLQTLLMFALFLIVEKGMAFWPASMESLNMAKDNFLPLLGYFVVATIIGGIGSILCGIGVVVTLPIAYCMYAVAYRAMFATGGGAEPTPPPSA